MNGIIEDRSSVSSADMLVSNGSVISSLPFLHHLYKQLLLPNHKHFVNYQAEFLFFFFFRIPSVCRDPTALPDSLTSYRKMPF